MGGSTDQAIIPILKALKFLTEDGAPTQRYYEYRNQASSKKVMAETLREAYADLFHLNEKISEKDRIEVEGKFKSTHNTTEHVAKFQAMTFFAFLKLADLDAKQSKRTTDLHENIKETTIQGGETEKDKTKKIPLGLNYNIQIHLPPTKDINVYNAIFKSLKEYLLEE